MIIIAVCAIMSLLSKLERVGVALADEAVRSVFYWCKQAWETADIKKSFEKKSAVLKDVYAPETCFYWRRGLLRYKKYLRVILLCLKVFYSTIELHKNPNLRSFYLSQPQFTTPSSPIYALIPKYRPSIYAPWA